MAFNFKGINEGGFAGYELTDQIQLNLMFWIEWGLLNNGAYNFYLSGQDSFFANNESILHPVIDERFPDRTVFDGVGREWVWESGVIPFSGNDAPFRVSGVYVNGNFVSMSDTGPYRHHVDYQRGRIIFDESIPSSDEISAEYTSKAVHIGLADDSDFNLLMLDTVKEFLTDTVPSGTPSKDFQVWLPSIFVELESGESTGLQLGGGQIKTRIVKFHIFADNKNDRNLLMDWLDYSNRSVFYMADLNKIQFPFNEYGDIIPGTTNWVDLTNNYPWKKLRCIGGRCKKINSLNTKLFRGLVTYNIEVDMENI